MKYRIGWPGWKIAYKLGFQIYCVVVIGYTPKEENCFYVADSDLFGLNTDAKTIDELIDNINECVNLLLDEMITDNKGRISILPQGQEFAVNIGA